MASGKRLDLWHQRFGHVHTAMILHMHKHGIVDGLKLSSNNTELGACEGCAHGKNARQSFPRVRSSPRAENLGEFFHTDVCGPMSQESYGGARYFVLFKDDCTGFRIIYCIRNKSEVFEKFKALQSFVLQETGNTISKIRSDRGGEYLSNEFIQYLKDAGVKHDLTAPSTPEQNGSVERENRTLIECIRSMIHGKKLSLCF